MRVYCQCEEWHPGLAGKQNSTLATEGLRHVRARDTGLSVLGEYSKHGMTTALGACVNAFDAAVACVQKKEM